MQSLPSQYHVRRERLLRGERGWWFLGPGGRCRLSADAVTADGELLPQTELLLRDRGLFAEQPIRSYSLTVLTSTDCNLGCAYCFQNIGQDPKGGSRPPRIARARLSSDTITEVLAFTGARMAEAGLDRLSLLLFGGEPLLNPRGCVELLRRAADYGLDRASMTSNAVLLTPALAVELEELGLRSVQVTFDGDRDDHDRIRVRRNGGATFDAIVSNLAAVSTVTNLRWDLRINVSQHNVAGIDRLLDQLAAVLDPARCAFVPALVGDVGIGYGNELRAGGDLVNRFVGWRTRAHQLGFQVPRPAAYSLCQACGVRDGRYGAVVNADGTLSSCWETAGKPEWQVGNVRTGYLRGVDERWVSCEDQHRHDESTAQLRGFHDALDAAFLDFLAQPAGR